MNQRKVEVVKRIWPQGYTRPFEEEVIGVGVFHCWGVNYEEFEIGPGNFSVAIVEMEDGSVLTPQPHEIRFIK